MTDHLLNVNIVLDNKSITVPYSSSATAEDVCIYICKQLNIGTIARHLFALRITGKNEFLTPAAIIGEKPTLLDFRIRFKVANIVNLKKRDINAYNYYFHQARNDVLENKIPDLIYEKYRRELVGLGITDMYRVMLEKDITRETVENDYKKYIPKEVLKRHSFFIKKPIHDTLGKLQKSVREASFVKAEYIRQLEIIAPEYLSETFRAVIDQDGSICNIIIKVSPYRSTEAGLLYCMESKKDQWSLICSIEDLGFISIRNDYTTEISRKTGIPFYLKFNSINVMLSFISLLDGYYRLTCKWTFNICKDVQTPSLQKLYSMKCHGPVGGEFSYAKLETKRGFRPGCFVIRESELKYGDFYLDVCMKEGLKPKTFKLEKINSDEFIFNNNSARFKTIQELMNAYQDPNESIYLQECLPPSEYDISPLLLCRKESLVGDSLTDTSSLDVLLPQGSPLCINCKSLQVYKGTLQTLRNNKEILKSVAKESPKAYYEWTFNGIFIKPEPDRVILRKDDIEIKNVKSYDAGLYVCMLFRINKRRDVLRVISLAVKSLSYDIDTRATRSLTLTCNSVILGYIYTDLSMVLYLNDQVYLDHGTTTLAAVNTHFFEQLNTSHSGDWKCVVQQKDLKLSWVTNYVRINVKKAPNLYTNLMEDKLTAPLFGWMKTEDNVLTAIITIVFIIILLVVCFLVIYYKTCTLKSSRYNRNRRK